MKLFGNCALLLYCLLFAAPAVAAPPVAGDMMPEMVFPVPKDPKGQELLGVQGKEQFALKDLAAELVFLEVVGVYCAQCVKQAPGFQTLFNRLNKGKYKGRVAMFGLAAGASDKEVSKLLSTGQYLFPIVSDPEFARHTLLGEPLTPYTIICRPDGTVLYAHLGVIEDIDGLYQQIKGLLD